MKIEFSDEEVKQLVRALVCSHGETYEDFSEDISWRGTNDLLLGKFMSSMVAFEAFNKARASRLAQEPLNKKLFMGAGTHSIVQVNLLHKRLAFATSELSAIQQNGGMGTEFDEQMDKECTQNIRDVIKDIMIAFDVKPEELCSPKQITCDDCGYYHPGGTCYDS